MKPTMLILSALLFITGAFAAAASDDAGKPILRREAHVAKVEQVSAKANRFGMTKAEAHQTPTRFIVAQSDVEPAENSTASDQPAVDESALRYFAAKGDRARLEAEIARLRALYPNWTPPADPLAIPENSDRQLAAMWKLYSEAKFTELRKAIAQRQAAESGWKPPADLMNRLEIAEKRQALLAASNGKNYYDVIRIGADTPSLLTCSEVDVLWRIAEAFAKTNRPSRSFDAYAYILKECSKPAERLATVQKAAALLDYGRMQALVQLEKTLPDGTREFEPVRDDLARRFVAEASKDIKLTIADSYLQRVDDLLAKQGKAADGLLLGWYYLPRKNNELAGRYFREAREIEDSASASQGLALVLIGGNDPKRAEDVMYRWRDNSVDASATYFAATANLLAIQPPPVIEDTILGRIAAAVIEKKNVPTAEQFGWYALAFQQPRTAAQWFRTVLGWKADYEPAAYGLAVARLRLKDIAGVREIQRLWAGRSDRIATIMQRRKRVQADSIPAPEGEPAQADAAVYSAPAAQQEHRERVSVRHAKPASRLNDTAERVLPAEKPVVVAIRKTGCRSTVDPERLSPTAALARGWCLMDMDRPLEAVAAFEVGLHSMLAAAREDAAYGQSLAYLRLGLVDEAAVSATRARLGSRRAVELQTAILSGRALNAFDAGRSRETIVYLDQLRQLQTERADLMVLRGYAYRKLNRRDDAVKIFEALAATGNRDAIKALGEIAEERIAR